MNEYDPRDRDQTREGRYNPHPEGASSHSPLFYGLFLAAGMIIGGLVLWGILGLVNHFRGAKPGLDPNVSSASQARRRRWTWKNRSRSRSSRR